MSASLNGSPVGGGASAPSGSGVVTASGGAFVSPVASAATTRSTLGLGSLATASDVTASQVSDSTTAGRALLTGADASAQRTSLGLGSLATASTVTASQVSDSTTAGRALLTAADASAQRTSLGLGGAAVLAVGTTAGTVAAGDKGVPTVGAEATVLTVASGVATWAAPAASVSRVPEPLLSLATTVSWNRTATTLAVDLAMDTGWTMLIVGRRLSGQGTLGTLEALIGYGTIGTGFYFGATDSASNSTGDPVVAIMYGSNIAGAGVSSQAQLGQSLPAPGATGANYCVAIEVRSSTIAISVNGAAATTVSRAGTFVPPTVTSDLYLGGRFNDFPSLRHGIAEITGIQQAVGDSALATLSAAGVAAMTVQNALSATNRSNMKFCWVVADGGAPLRAGQAPITQTGIVPFALAT